MLAQCQSSRRNVEKPGFPSPLLSDRRCSPAVHWEGRSAAAPLPGARAFGPHPGGGYARPNSPAGGGLGKPGFPSPLREGVARPNPPASGGMGEPGSPNVRRSCAWRTPPRCTCPGSAGVPPAPRRRGHGAGPRPDSPPPGAGTRLLPPAGEGWEGGCTQRTMVTSAVHAAAPHHVAMKISLFLGGLRPPKPSRGRGNGGTGLPHAPAHGLPPPNPSHRVGI